MKLIIEFIVSLIFHPLAMILAWLNIAGRSDLTGSEKIVWAVVCFLWGIGPILYMLVGGGELW